MNGLEGQITAFAKLILISMVPFVLAAQGTMLSGRTGVFNVAQEGIMLVAASVGFLVAYGASGNLFVGIIAAAILGGIFGLALAYFTTHLKMDQFVIGLALFFIGVALSTLLPKLVLGITLEPPLIPTLQNIPIPLLSQIPYLGEILFNQNILVYFSIVVSAVLYWFLYHTRLGLDLRSVGENPLASDSLGVNVFVMRYIAAILGGVLDWSGRCISPHGLYGHLHDGYGARARLDLDCPHLLWWLEPTHDLLWFTVLCRCRSAGFQGAGEWCRASVPIFTDATFHRDNSGNDGFIPPGARAGLPWSKLRSRKAYPILIKKAFLILSLRQRGYLTEFNTENEESLRTRYPQTLLITSGTTAIFCGAATTILSFRPLLVVLHAVNHFPISLHFLMITNSLVAVADSPFSW